MENIVLIGFKGSGKTAVGKPLAKKLHMQFIDVDDVIEKMHTKEKKEKLSVRSMFKKYGEEYFRLMESRALESLQKETMKVIATGGGSVVAPPNRSLIQSLGTVVFLDAAKEKLFLRIQQRGFPPFFDKEHPRKSFEEFYDERKDIYTKIGDIAISLKGETKREVVEKIIRELV